MGAPDAGETREFSAEICELDNLRVDDPAEWAVTNPAFASVDPNGTVMALADGSLTRVATYLGVASTATIPVVGETPP